MHTSPTPLLATLLTLATLAWSHAVGAETQIAGDFTAANPRIDFTAFLDVAHNAYQVREPAGCQKKSSSSCRGSPTW